MTDVEYELMKQNILKKIRKGYSRSNLTEWVMKEYDCIKVTANKWIKQVYADMLVDTEDLQQSAKQIQLERLEDLLKEALESKDRKTALGALEMINKIYSLYTEKKEIKLDTDNLVFKFGDEVEEVRSDEPAENI